MYDLHFDVSFPCCWQAINNLRGDAFISAFPDYLNGGNVGHHIIGITKHKKILAEDLFQADGIIHYHLPAKAYEQLVAELPYLNGVWIGRSERFTLTNFPKHPFSPSFLVT